MDCDLQEIQNWLDEEHPDLFVKKWLNGEWSIEQRIKKTCRCQWEEDSVLVWQETGCVNVCKFRNILPSLELVKKEVARRDPKKAHWSGNLFHEGYLESKKAELERERQIKEQQESARKQWEIVKNSPVIQRVSKALENGDSQKALDELKLETIFKHALKENKKETLAIAKQGGIDL